MVRHPSNNQNFKRYNGSFTKFRPKLMQFVHKTIDFPQLLLCSRFDRDADGIPSECPSPDKLAQDWSIAPPY